MPVQTLGWGRRARLSLWPVAKRSMTMDGRYHGRNWSSKNCLRTIGLYGSLLTDLKCILLKFIYVYICLSVCATCIWVHRGQKRVLTLELELHMVVDHLTWLLETDFRSLGGAASIFNH